MTHTTPAPRLHVLMRPESERAVVIRQGPSKTFCTIGWDLARDRFEVGQWCKHKLYPERCDISPDGAWMVYFALDGRWRGEAAGAWTALSRAPYLKAVALWPQGHTWGGGGMIYAADRLPARIGPLPPQPPLPAKLRLIASSRTEKLARDGWIKTKEGHEKQWTKRWRVRKKLRTPYLEAHALIAADSVLDRRSWQWAEVDVPRNRVVWAEHGRIYAARATRSGELGSPGLLFDATGMQFEPLAAPYDADPVIFARVG